MYLRNAWYVAAWSREVTRGLLARTFLDEPVVLWRRQDGLPCAIEDRCCHRSLPLSLGAVIGDDLRCGYHGLKYDGSGACIEIPGQPNIPERARVKSYPLAERYGCVWIWMGDPALADPAKLPDLWWCEHADWVTTRPDMVHLNADYRLIADNVLDATHLTYVHASSIGTESLTEIEPLTTQKDDEVVRVERWIYNRPPPPAYQKAGHFTGPCDRWAAVEFHPPNFCVNFAGCVDAGLGGPGKDLSLSQHKVELVALSLPTPETSTSQHYFFAFARAFGLNDPEVEAFFSAGMLDVFREDFVILEAQQHRMNQMPNAVRIDIKTDNGPILARRMLDRLIMLEHTPA
ncbi:MULTISPECIES: aromatic ring-hydroxylating dioxygenase subunit alpha [unclassified Beijerinckia]|uniref:aromatic ring-hydroxylating dioxygenase subunit alpha n=1 Tax=unclassified Beijerinckia TaxID=2638183 RepID=UPI000896DD97|nr:MULTISPECIES: aromatic ring-hydroxylating dioxygenase subunit alpha [unclassified Beijerinckia]MDH7798382.1 phenylpropionate dioxygenase-like ring-hydroxylating dioxygenase large terminal subunit [Beijerinckia sp. GAS462]SED19039.1 vanillate O-demethylase monooxygenase subunit/p-toluenesulfonate methyl-monooxygenase oxygenase component TsaM [Beijerinckia sp. 28-YEA-48]